MSTAGLVAFNLLVNGVGSFAVAWLFARAAIRLFRPGPGRASLALLALPFLKLAFELAHGVPAGSFLWLRAQGVPQDLGSFKMGFGLFWCFPKVDFTLGALSGGLRYSQSAADLLAAFLMKRAALWAPGAIAALLLSVAAVRLGARAAGWRRAATLASSDTPLGARIASLLDAPPPPRLGFRHVWSRALLTLWVCVAALGAVAFGNH